MRRNRCPQPKYFDVDACIPNHPNQVVERSASLYQLIFSVTMNLGIERYGDSGACDSNFTAGGQVGGLTEKATASLSLRESDIRAMLSRYIDISLLG